MPDNVIKVVNDMGKQDKMPYGIQFHNIHHESTFSDLYANNDPHDDDSCASDKHWKLRENLKRI